MYLILKRVISFRMTVSGFGVNVHDELCEFEILQRLYQILDNEQKQNGLDYQSRFIDRYFLFKTSVHFHSNNTRVLRI